MNAFAAAFWSETLKARRSRITLLTTMGFLILPCVGGLFMIILKNPAQAQSWGLISTKAQLAVGVADWPSYFEMIFQGVAILGALLFGLITTWVFGREFAERTAKEIMALPASRAVIVAAKFSLLAVWALALTLLVLAASMIVGWMVDIPGWSAALGWKAAWSILLTAFLSFLLSPFVALVASWGRGYLPAVGWMFLTLLLANIVAVMGWGEWFPWAIPVLAGGMGGSEAGAAGLHSYIVVVVTFLAGLAATLTWWQRADQVR